MRLLFFLIFNRTSAFEPFHLLQMLSQFKGMCGARETLISGQSEIPSSGGPACSHGQNWSQACTWGQLKPAIKNSMCCHDVATSWVFLAVARKRKNTFVSSSGKTYYVNTHTASKKQTLLAALQRCDKALCFYTVIRNDVLLPQPAANGNEWLHKDELQLLTWSFLVSPV